MTMVKNIFNSRAKYKKIRNYIHRLRYFFKYFGLSYYCPFCKKFLRKLLPRGVSSSIIKTNNIIGMGRRNCYCPFCFSTDKERLLLLFLITETDIFNKKKFRKILHFAPEKNLGSILRSSNNLEYISADLYSKNVMIKMDVTDIKFEDDYFDVVICNHVLEHVPNDRKAIREIYRVIKPGGWAILQVPISYSLKKTYEDPGIESSESRLRSFGQEDHLRIYGMDYIKRLEEVCFEVDIFDPASRFGGLKIKRYGLFPGEKVFIARKRVMSKN